MSASRLQGVIQFNIAFSIAVKLIFSRAGRLRVHKPLARYCRRHRRDAYRRCERAPVTSSRAASIKMQRRRRANPKDAAEED
jgi:hypothetical protein